MCAPGRGPDSARAGDKEGWETRVTAARARGSERTLGAGDLGGPLGERATLVQFSSAFCQPCRVTRRVLADVAAMVPGVAHVEIDAEGALDLVRELRVLKTPTVLVLDRAGRVVRRAVGQPRKADVIAALGAAV
ncbi:thioredoxin family protein [Streptomyces spectabilis]|uniref:Thioredoxin family protein n=1 Tax=Streptomyces spectabilis TaxID=68270 RepID=A0A516RI48_STRST|nr:thioredoxin family protein [Streptomyces spectabilis]